MHPAAPSVHKTDTFYDACAAGIRETSVKRMPDAMPVLHNDSMNRIDAYKSC